MKLTFFFVRLTWILIYFAIYTHHIVIVVMKKSNEPHRARSNAYWMRNFALKRAGNCENLFLVYIFSVCLTKLRKISSSVSRGVARLETLITLHERRLLPIIFELFSTPSLAFLAMAQSNIGWASSQKSFRQHKFSRVSSTNQNENNNFQNLINSN